ncbi:MAG: T9SS type A sorting domain-containing protein [Ignavibacteria bacterium]|nr:T9SS type A sorting domain-containing protein [Ignavibacteria bacterium]
MKKVFLFSLIAALCIFAFNYQSPEPAVINNIAVQFVTTNNYGNNLYVDNFSIGNQYTNDVTVTSVNIPKDTNYSFAGTATFKVAPTATVMNVGSTTASGFNVVMTAGAYTSTKSVSSVASGTGINVVFDSLTITPNTPLNMKIYSTWASDMNKANDTLTQYTYYLPGVRRNVLIEAYTQWNCGPCAANTPYLDAFQSAHWDSLCIIRYHAWWPGSNNDPMYLYNTVQCSNRIRYYGVNGVPDGDMDGTYLHIFPYSPPDVQFGVPFYTRLNKGTPIGIHVTDSRIAGDSIKSDITINIVSPLVAGNYKLRVNAVERIRSYSGGSNGETSFKDIFRRMYPDTNGFAIPTTVGTYNYTYKYKRETEWIDSLVYTVAYVQNDVNKEVMNCDKGRRWALDAGNRGITPDVAGLKAMHRPEGDFYNNKMFFNTPQTDNIDAGFNFEVFESSFPPSGWSISNPDAGVTWSQFTGANGPLFPGSKCVTLPFYSYSGSGQNDYLNTRVYNNLDLTDSIRFNYAYAVYTGYADRLQVQLSTNGGSTYPYTIFDKSGSSLATAPATTSNFVPASASEWGRFSVALGTILAVTRTGTEVPTHFALMQNYPNPFNPVTNIVYMLPKSSQVSLKVYDVKGQLIETLFEGRQNQGIYITQFEGAKYASGMYFYKLDAGDYKEVKKMVLIK